MAFSGGVFSRLYSWINDKNNGLNIDSTRMDNEMNGMANALSTCVLKDGTQTITANLPMNTFRHTGIGNAAARNDYAAAGQIQDGSLVWVAAGGTADALTATLAPAISTLVDGMELRVRALLANATTTPSIAFNGLTAVTITKNGGSALAAGDIAGVGHELILRYALAANHMELLNPKAASTVSDASLSTSDITTNNVSSTKHGFAPKSPADATQFLNGGATNAYASVKDSDLSLTDITTNNVSTSKHGFVPKAPQRHL